MSNNENPEPELVLSYLDSSMPYGTVGFATNANKNVYFKGKFD